MRTLATGCCDFAESDGTRERAPLSADNTISEVNAGVPVLMNASSLWASRLQVSTYKDQNKIQVEKIGDLVSLGSSPESLSRGWGEERSWNKFDKKKK